jgi:hypothetical protein
MISVIPSGRSIPQRYTKMEPTACFSVWLSIAPMWIVKPLDGFQKHAGRFVFCPCFPNFLGKEDNSVVEKREVETANLPKPGWRFHFFRKLSFHSTHGAFGSGKLLGIISHTISQPKGFPIPSLYSNSSTSRYEAQQDKKRQICKAMLLQPKIVRATVHLRKGAFLKGEACGTLGQPRNKQSNSNIDVKNEYCHVNLLPFLPRRSYSSALWNTSAALCW